MIRSTFLVMAAIPVLFLAQPACAADAANTHTTILLMDDPAGGRVHAVRSSQTFYDGERFRLSVRARQQGYLYILCLTSQGEAKLLYPSRSGDDNLIQSPAARTIPERGWYRFDREAGEEQIFVILSRAPLPELQQAIGLRDMGPEMLERYAAEALRSESSSRGIEIQNDREPAVERIALRHESRDF